jgi:hypothetical protein
MNRLTLAAAALLLTAAPALAQSNISPTSKLSWQENTGWMNWRDASGGGPAASSGVRVSTGYLAGNVWCENLGWLTLGDGSPNGPGGKYANTSDADYGVNRDPLTGNLTGYAWGENIGWVNFSGGAVATPAQPARFTVAAARFTGYAWSENAGWINLDLATPGAFVGATISCSPADVGQQGGLPGPDAILDNNDFVVFINDFFQQNPAADMGQQGGLSGADGHWDNNDFVVFINLFFAGCG